MSPKRKYPPTLFFTGLMVSLGRGLFSFPLTLAGSFIVFFFGCLGSRSRAWDYGILFVLFLCGLVKVVYATKRDRLKGFFALLSVVDLAAAAALVSPYLPSVSHWAALIVLGLWLLPALSRQLLFMIVALTPGDDPEVEEFLDMMFDPDNQTDAVASGMGDRLSGKHYKSCEIIASVLDALGKNLQPIHSGTFQRTDCSNGRIVLLRNKFCRGSGVGKRM